MAEYIVNSESLSSVAEAIRTKGNTTESLEFPQGFVDAVNAIESGGGGEDTLRALLTNTLKEYAINDAISMSGVRLARNMLKKFVTPNLTAIDQYTFYQCSNLNYLDLGRISTLSTSVFSGLHKLETVIFRKDDSAVSLSAAFINCNSILREDYSYYCYFYVPKALIEDYKVATNWSNYANRFRAIEDYPEITGGVI